MIKMKQVLGMFIDDFRASTISLKKTFGALQSDWLLGPSSTDACSQAALVSH
jgi:hypothetical protein